MCSWKGSAEIREEAFIYWTVFLAFIYRTVFFKKTREKRCHSLRRREYYIPSLSPPVVATVIPEVLL
jgi:hypothetical protein